MVLVVALGLLDTLKCTFLPLERSVVEAQAPLFRSKLMNSRSDVAHGFTGRSGGVSVGPLAELNLGDRPGETRANLEENWARVVRSLDTHWRVEQVAVMNQVHGAKVVHVDVAGGPLEPVGDADGAVTLHAGVVLAVRTADCVPVLLACGAGVAVAHAGWRGTVAGIVPQTAQLLLELTGGEPSDVIAAIGPSISGDAYEVGKEVVDAVRASGVSDEVYLSQVDGQLHVDLAAVVKFQLRSLGIEQTDHMKMCTYGDQRFFSHRRSGANTGRIAGVIARRPR